MTLWATPGVFFDFLDNIAVANQVRLKGKKHEQIFKTDRIRGHDCNRLCA
jgi:hypothetical protein